MNRTFRLLLLSAVIAGTGLILNLKAQAPAGGVPDGMAAQASTSSLPDGMAEPASWTSLFNGKDFTGFYTWLPKLGRDNDPNHIFQVENGVIHLYGQAPDQSEQPFGYIATRDEYSNFHLIFEYKWGNKQFAPRLNVHRDSGVLYLAFGPDGAHNGWPQSIECQVQEKDTGDIFLIGTLASSTIDPAQITPKQYLPTDQGGVAYTKKPGDDDRIKRSEQYDAPEGWNVVEIIVKDGHGSHIVNGSVNNRWHDALQPDPAHSGKWIPLRKGHIVLQAEGAEIYFRNIRIKKLTSQ